MFDFGLTAQVRKHFIVPAPFPSRLARYRARFERLECQANGPTGQRRTATFALPTLPLLSKARNEIVCSPGLITFSSSAYFSLSLSALPSSGKMGLQAEPS